MEQRIKKLYQLIRKYDTAYYGQGKSLITDKEYDDLYRELTVLEEKYPHLVAADSPRQRIGNDLTKEFAKVAHSQPMMSIDNTYSYSELREWVKRVQKNLHQSDIDFIGELKIDGIACALKYDQGKLIQAITRGNGIIGDDITVNARTIRSLPLQVSEQNPFEVRGEIYLTFDNFNQLNTALVENGQPPMQNPRNTAAGTVKLLNPVEVAKRKLSFFAHFLLSQSSTEYHYNNLSFLRGLGIPTILHSEILTSIDEIIAFCEHWESARNSIPYPVDGVVIKVNNMQQQKELGETAKSPRWIIAFKYQPESAITEVLSIDAQVGRTGVITPVARLKPVLLSGSTIKNATLHNYDEIIRLGIGLGDQVEIEKSGEIIPRIIRVITRQDSHITKSFPIPDQCPSCQSKLIRIQEEVAIRCVNSSCPAQIFASLTHFVSREAMNIEGLGPSLLNQLIKLDIIKSPADIFSLSVDTLASLERMGTKSAENVVKAINKAKKNPLEKLLFGLGIRMIGSQSAKILASLVDDISELQNLDQDQLTSIDTLGPRMAENIYYYFKQDKNLKVIEQLRAAGVNCQGNRSHVSSSKPLPLAGKSYVLTGTLENLTRKDAQNHIEDLGGTVSSSISKKTTGLICGKAPGSKLKKAQKLNIPIIDEIGFSKMIGV